MQDVPNAYENWWINRDQSGPSQPPPPPSEGPPQPRSPDRMSAAPGAPVVDDATRYLCAASHLNCRFAAHAIKEFLSEPLRAVAPSPGVVSAAVLRDAVAAMTRRRWRDALLALLLTVVLVASPLIFGSWLTAAALWNSFGSRRRAVDGQVRRRMTTKALIVVLLLSGVIGAVDSAYLLARSAASFTDPEAADGSPGRFALAMVAALLALGVLLADRLAVWSLLTKSFRRGRFTVWGEERLRTAGSGGAWGRQLEALPADAGANVIVYLGSKPFVGWGSGAATFSITTPLQAVEDGGDRAGRHDNGRANGHRPAPAFALSELYAHLGVSLAELRRSTPGLSPSHRLAGLQEASVVVVPADHLVMNFGDSAANLVLADPGLRPARLLDQATTRRIAEAPREWMRCYQVFWVETWDRQMVVSLFLHIGADRERLYFEWTPCVLAPVAAFYRQIDTFAEGTVSAPALDALGSWVTLPSSIFSRLVWAFRRAQGPAQRGWDFSAGRYGARYSVRELGAESGVKDYLHEVDALRYSRLMQDRMFSATVDFMLARGISPTRFIEQAKNIQNNQYNFDQRFAYAPGGSFGVNSGTGAASGGPGAEPAAG
jgi:hypothetical protein